MAGFTGPIRKPRTSITYQLGAVIVALLMVLLPVVYLGVIALAMYGVYYHAVNHTGILTTDDVRGRAKIFAFLLYVAPIVVGAVLTLFMIKPLFARSERGGRTRSLRREAEPLLFAFVDRICATVGAPLPKQIDVDCDINASARFRRGMLSMLGSDLVLTIGMPLIAGLNTRQLAGVLAHEFGHFSQGFGMRLTYLIRSLSHWFMRVVYQRDRADEWLQQSAAEADIRFGWILYLAMGGVWISRRVLWVLMYVGHFFGSYLLRQMEFDADRYETRLAGSGAFEQTARQLHVLNFAAQGAYADLREFYREGRLGDDLPRLIMARAAQISPEVKQAIDKEIATRKTGLFDTHPCDGDRIIAAKREDSDGVFRIEMPAGALLTNFEASSKAATLEFYRGIFGSQLEKAELRPVAEIVAKHQRAREGESALERFFQVEWSLFAPLALDGVHLAPPANAAATLEQLKTVRRQMVEKVEAIRGAAQLLRDSRQKASEAQQLGCLLRANVKLNKQTIAAAGGADGVKRANVAAEKDIERALQQLRVYNQLATQRISLALALYRLPKVVARVPEPRPSAADVDAIFEALRTLSGAMATLVTLGPQHASLGALFDALQSGSRPEEVSLIIRDLMDRMLPRAKTMRGSLERSYYPFEHAKGRVTLSQYVMPEVPVTDDLASIYNSIGQAMETAPTLYVRLLGEIVHTVERTEIACGLSSLAAAATAAIASG